MVKSTELGMYVRSSKTRNISIGYVDDINMVGRKQNMAPMWKKQMKNVDLDEPTSFLDHVHLGCTQRQCKPTETIIDEYRKMFESRIISGEIEKLHGWEKSHTKTVAWLYDMEGRAKKCQERYCESANSQHHTLTTTSKRKN